MNDPGPPRDLLDRLTIPGDAEAAAREYLGHADWLVGTPPAAVLAVMSDPQTSQDGDVVRLARAWPARDLVPALCALIESGSAPSGTGGRRGWSNRPWIPGSPNRCSGWPLIGPATGSFAGT